MLPLPPGKQRDFAPRQTALEHCPRTTVRVIRSGLTQRVPPRDELSFQQQERERALEAALGRWRWPQLCRRPPLGGEHLESFALLAIADELWSTIPSREDRLYDGRAPAAKRHSGSNDATGHSPP